MTGFLGPAQEIINETPKNLSDEEREFDNLVHEYQQVRRYSTNLASARRKLTFEG